MSFIIYALPRSRTYWLSKFLTYGDWQCGHDELRHARTMDDVRSWLSQPCTGTVETAAAPFWRLAKDIKTVVIRRPVTEVVDSMGKLGIAFDRDHLTKIISNLDHKLDQIERRVPNVISVNFADLTEEATCRTLFEHCLPYPHDAAWWRSMTSINLQINMHHLIRYYQSYQPQMTKLAKIAKHQTIAAMNQSVSIDKDDGIVIAEEPFSTLFADGKTLISDHLVLVGDAPDAEKNWPLLQALQDTGHLQVMTARCNGRVFGYLVSVIAPSLESTSGKSAVQTSFYASPEFKGIGMRLQRASIEALREKGVNLVHFQAGVRGSGPRLSTIYRRLGAINSGEVFKLDLAPK